MKGSCLCGAIQYEVLGLGNYFGITARGAERPPALRLQQRSSAMPPNSVGYLVHPWLRHMKLRCEERHPDIVGPFVRHGASRATTRSYTEFSRDGPKRLRTKR
jgi:hypothetical protein